MFKAFSILALLILPIFLGPQKTHAQNRLTHENYALFTLDQKKDVIRQTMQLMVEIEARYTYENQKFGPNKERTKKYTQLMKKMEEFFFSPAYASAGGSYQAQLARFTQLLNRSDRCLYGGWLSEIRNGHCTHPLNLPRSNPERQAYGTAGCKHPREISCNPLIFGFKDKGKESLFCVPAGIQNDNAHNAALNCMKKALATPNEGDAAEDRLAYLAQQLEQNPAMAKVMHDYITKACVCQNPPPGLEKDYHAYMRPHRTCYGLMRTIAEASAACTTPPLGGESMVMIQALQAAVAAPESSGEQIDDFYTSFLDLLAKSKEFERICGPSTTTQLGTDGGTDGDEDGNGGGPGDQSGTQSGSSGGDDQGGTQGTQSRDPSDDGGDEGLLVTDSPQDDPTAGPGGDTGPQTPQVPPTSAGGAGGGDGGDSGGEAPIAPTSSDEETGDEDDSTTQVTIEVDITEEDKDHATLTISDPKDLPQDATIIWFAKDGGDFKDLTPPTEVNPTPPEATSDSETTPEEPKEETITPPYAPPKTLTEVKDEPAEGEHRFEVKSRTIQVTKRDEDYVVCAKLVRNGVVISNTSCETITRGSDGDSDENKDDEDKDYIITLSPTPRKSKLSIEVTIKDHETLPEGVIVVWYGQTTITTPAPEVPKGSQAGNIGDDTEEETKEPETKKPTLEELTATPGVDKKEGSGLNIAVDLKEETYTMCAQLFKGSKSVSNEACTKVPKKKAPVQTAPAGFQMPPMQQLPPAIRGSDLILRGKF